MFIPPPPLSGTYNRAPSGGVHSSTPSVRYIQPSTIGRPFIPPPPLSGKYNRAPSGGIHSSTPLCQVRTTEHHRGVFIPPPPLSGTYNRAPSGGVHSSTPSVRYVQPSTIGGHSFLHPLCQVRTTEHHRGGFILLPPLSGTYNRAPSGGFILLPPLSGTYNRAPSGGVHSSTPSVRYIQPSTIGGHSFLHTPLSGKYNRAPSGGIHSSTPSVRYVQPSTIGGHSFLHPLCQVRTTEHHRGAFIPPPPLSGMYNRAPSGGIHFSTPSVRYVQPSTIGGRSFLHPLCQVSTTEHHRGAFIPPPPLSGTYNRAPSGSIHSSTPSVR